MASGKAIGEFSLKAITATYSPGPAGSVLDQVNWEGTASGFGAVFATATYVGGPKSIADYEWWTEMHGLGVQVAPINVSVYSMPDASTRTRTSLRPAVGSGASTISSPSGSPKRVT